MEYELNSSERLVQALWFLKRQLRQQENIWQGWFPKALLLLLLSLCTLRWTFILPIYLFFIGSFVTGVLLINHNTLCPNVLWMYVRPLKGVKECEVVDECCHVCGKSDCGRHRVELSTASLQPWIDLEVPASLNTALEDLFSLILKEYVHSWYNDMSTDEAFPDEIKTNIRFSASIIIRRLKKVDLARFISDKVLKMCMRHLHHCINCLKDLKTTDSLQELEALEQRLLESFETDLHMAVRTREMELQYLSTLSQHLLLLLLPEPVLNSKSLHVLMREMLAGLVLLPSIDLLSHPDCLNNLLLIYLRDSPEERVEEKRRSDMVPVLQSYQSKGALSRSKHLQLRLTAILSDPDLLYPFMQFMKAESSVNVLQFYLVIEEFNRKILTPELSGDKLLELHLELRKLYDTYFEASAKDCIRFDSDLTSQIKSICEGPAKEVVRLQTTTPLFRAYEHTYDLLEHNFLPLFHQSDIYYTMVCGERVPTKLLKANSLRLLKRGSTSESLSKLGSRIKGVFRSSAVDGRMLSDDVDYDVQEVHVSECVEAAMGDKGGEVEEMVEGMDEEDAGEDGVSDLSLWVVSIPRLQTDVSKKNVLFQLEVKRLPDDKDGMHEPQEWCIERRYHEFYVLETKLKEFHGVFDDCQLPAKRTFLPKDRAFFEALRPDFESFLRILLTKPTLRGSQLLHSFLASQQEFTTSILDVNLGKRVKSGAMKLVREKGQHLEAFLKSFLLSTEAPKSKPARPTDHDTDTVSISSEKVMNSVYGNNANLPDLPHPSSHHHHSSSLSLSEDASFANHICSYFDALLYLCWRVFSSPQWLLQLLWSLRTFAKRSIDCYLEWYVAGKLDEALREDNVVTLVHLLRDALFFDNDPVRSEEDKVKRRQVAYEALQNYIPNFLMERKSDSGLRLLFNLFQLPRLNKQLVYVLLDLVLLELFPELEHSEALKKK